MTTLKHSCNSLSGIYEQECIERLIPLRHPLCLKLQKMTFRSPKRYKDKINFFRCPFFAIKRMNLTREHSSEKYKNINSSLNIPLTLNTNDSNRSIVGEWSKCWLQRLKPLKEENSHYQNERIFSRTQDITVVTSFTT